jgi:hypothetical protein
MVRASFTVQLSRGAPTRPKLGFASGADSSGGYTGDTAIEDIRGWSRVV